MIDTSAYMMRISQAGPVQLIIINFEITLDFLAEAKKALLAQDSESFITGVQKAKNGLDQLIQSLNFEIPLATDFNDIYRYVYKRLCDVHFSSEASACAKAVDEAVEILETLLVGWRDVEKQVESLPPADSGNPKVYSGLTYGRDGQAKEYVNEGEGRSYTV